jgi:ubiquitin carboxyl-terminal hydrolase L5
MIPPPPQTEDVLEPADTCNEQTMDSASPALPDSTHSILENDDQPSSTSNIAEDMSSPLSSQSDSPTPKKRALPEPAAEEPSSKKLKESLLASPNQKDNEVIRFPSSADYPATQHDKETWQGFCDIESDPAYFSVILRELGVEGVTVREVFALTPDLLEMLPQPIYGLILCFRYREFGNDDRPTECPGDVWFANQLPAQNSCGTLAMTNILMNNPDIIIGEHLNQFKDFTSGLTSFQRGEAFASFDFIKKTHNSFAKKMDLLENDRHLKHKVARTQREKKIHEEEAFFERKGNNGKKADDEKAPNRKSNRRQSAESIATDDSADSYEDNAHHFIAFVPVRDELWKLDGYDAQATSMGSWDISKGETWLSTASETIATLMASGDDDYSVIALSQSPLSALRKIACLTINTIAHVDARLDEVAQDWKAFVIADEEPTFPRLLGIADNLPAFPVPESLKAKIDAELQADLLDRRSRLTQELSTLAAGIMMEIQEEAEQEQKSKQRRYDCGPVLKKWLEMLAENEWLAENLDTHMPGGAKKGNK